MTCLHLKAVKSNHAHTQTLFGATALCTKSFTPLVISLLTDLEPHPYLGSVRLWKYKATDVKRSIIICILETYLYEVGLVLRKTKLWQTKGTALLVSAITTPARLQ